MITLHKNADKRLKLYIQTANGCRVMHDAKLVPPLLRKNLFDAVLSLTHSGESTLASS